MTKNLVFLIAFLLANHCDSFIRYTALCKQFHPNSCKANVNSWTVLLQLSRSHSCKKTVNSVHLRHNHVTPLFCSAADGIEDKAALIKLPILQIIRKKELSGEFICGNDLLSAVDKFSATLSSLEKKHSLDTLIQPGNYGIRNIYSDDQLLETLDSATNDVILKIFREGCKKCALLEPIIDDLSRDPIYSKFVFLQADVSNIELYTKNLKERLSGSRVGNTGDCATCLDSGFVICKECNGLGYVQKGTLAAFCPSCTGYKKVRCTTCGGQCPKCS